MKKPNWAVMYTIKDDGHPDIFALECSNPTPILDGSSPEAMIRDLIDRADNPAPLPPKLSRKEIEAALDEWWINKHE